MSSDSEGLFDESELSDGEMLSKTEALYREPTDQVLEKTKDKTQRGSLAVYLASCGAISKDDLLLLEPALYRSRISYDPVGVDPNKFVTRSPDFDPDKEVTAQIVAPSYSIRNGTKVTTTGASSLEAFVTNSTVETYMDDIPKKPMGLRVDRPVSQVYIDGSCEVLHEPNVIFHKLLSAAISLSIFHITPRLYPALDTLYSFRAGEVYSLLEKNPKATAPIVLERLKKAILNVLMDLNESQAVSFAGFCAVHRRIFPHPELFEETFCFLGSEIHPEGVYAFDRLQTIFRDLPQRLSAADLEIVTRFALFHRNFIRLKYPSKFFKMDSIFAAWSRDWNLIYESIITDALRDRSILEYDKEPYKLPCEGLKKTIESAARLLEFTPIDSPIEFEVKYDFQPDYLDIVVLSQEKPSE